jgi:hypothetical protein
MKDSEFVDLRRYVQAALTVLDVAQILPPTAKQSVYYLLDEILKAAVGKIADWNEIENSLPY